MKKQEFNDELDVIKTMIYEVEVKMDLLARECCDEVRDELYNIMQKQTAIAMWRLDETRRIASNESC